MGTHWRQSRERAKIKAETRASILDLGKQAKSILKIIESGETQSKLMAAQSLCLRRILKQIYILSKHWKISHEPESTEPIQTQDEKMDL